MKWISELILHRHKEELKSLHIIILNFYVFLCFQRFAQSYLKPDFPNTIPTPLQQLQHPCLKTENGVTALVGTPLSVKNETFTKRMDPKPQFPSAPFLHTPGLSCAKGSCPISGQDVRNGVFNDIRLLHVCVQWLIATHQMKSSVARSVWSLSAGD